MNNAIVVLDNGASKIKAGIVNGQLEETRCVLLPTSSWLSQCLNKASIIPNAVVRSKGDKMTYFGHEMERCKDYSSLHFRLPFEKVCPQMFRRPEQETIFLQQCRDI
jgi:actin-related protein 6